MAYNKKHAVWKYVDPTNLIDKDFLEHIEQGVFDAHEEIDGRLSDAALNATYGRKEEDLRSTRTSPRTTTLSAPATPPDRWQRTSSTKRARSPTGCSTAGSPAWECPAIRRLVCIWWWWPNSRTPRFPAARTTVQLVRLLPVGENVTRRYTRSECAAVTP